jgi:hypothetical protein
VWCGRLDEASSPSLELAREREAGCLTGRERRREVRKEDAQGMKLAGGREAA